MTLPLSHLASHTCWTSWRQLSDHVGDHGRLCPCGTHTSGTIGDQSRDASCFHRIPSHQRRVHVFLPVCQPLQDLLLRGRNVILPLPTSEWRDDQWCNRALRLPLQIQHHLLESAHFCTGIGVGAPSFALARFNAPSSSVLAEESSGPTAKLRILAERWESPLFQRPPGTRAPDLGCLLLRDVELPHRPSSLFPSPSSATAPTEVGVRE